MVIALGLLSGRCNVRCFSSLSGAFDYATNNPIATSFNIFVRASKQAFVLIRHNPSLFFFLFAGVCGLLRRWLRRSISEFPNRSNACTQYCHLAAITLKFHELEESTVSELQLSYNHCELAVWRYPPWR